MTSSNQPALPSPPDFDDDEQNVPSTGVVGAVPYSIENDPTFQTAPLVTLGSDETLISASAASALASAREAGAATGATSREDETIQSGPTDPQALIDGTTGTTQATQATSGETKQPESLSVETLDLGQPAADDSEGDETADDDETVDDDKSADDDETAEGDETIMSNGFSMPVIDAPTREESFSERP
nr:hypothetical protein [Candidatus Melainabacteria bacterium]